MFDKSIGPSFAKVYYHKYITDPTSLSVLYAENAVFSHSEVQKGMAGSSESIRDIYGISEITAELEAINSKRTKTKVTLMHIDSMPTGKDALTVLVGGYFLRESGPVRFVQNFVLQGCQTNNNFVVVNDCLRIYEKKGPQLFDAFSNDVTVAAQGKDAIDLTKSTTGDQGTSTAQQASNGAKTKPHANHESWCDEIEREEEEIRQQQKKDQSNFDILDKTMASVNITESATDAERFAAAEESTGTEGKVFSYAAAAKRAPPAGENKNISVQSVSVKSPESDGQTSEQTKDKKTRNGLKSPRGEGKLKSRSKGLRRDGPKKSEGKPRDEKSKESQ
mmetsp:Transcript_40085/g.63385  ORF Transcript_40085/g.63385 Transcript_40085/m.63385 type:complete len:334 (-) Transcript_40085:92-1093(-)|eukprot:CAMPEP_0201522204 /NCGR_PEP_ID=MMETSP0161_2-20130828/16515_1 /ASSEMBLY_ACC=CAM_ASM_000251 /TAXON_ID=180227 /ORGANISM="Neoparamoeba aestuarina, Strain SoJaBio B1-5/56/2" /LENGTH=333 /DNA_ID=CAMNT_0047920979 /DNA_START=24 /DNA_END=1025 /DNA_ORIENTATION=-